MLKDAIAGQLSDLSDGQDVMLKLTLPSEDNLYADFVAHPRVVRVCLALSGGYSRRGRQRTAWRGTGGARKFLASAH